MVPSFAFADELTSARLDENGVVENEEKQQGVLTETSVLLSEAVLDEASLAKQRALIEESNLVKQQEKIYKQQLKEEKSSLKKYISKQSKKYKNELDSKKRSTLKNIKNKVKYASKIESVVKLKKKASKVFSKARTLLKAKNKLIKQTNKLYSSNKNYMQSNQVSSIKSIINSIKKAKSKSPFKRLIEKRDLIIYQAKMSRYINANGWTKAHLDYVNEWGKRNNNFLRNTPMSGTGYLIAESAYKHNMDPRICASIASVESGCGRQPYCCKYNVWGWVWDNPQMYSWEDAIEKWNSYFSSFFGGERYPISSMHGYGGYGPSYVNNVMRKI